MIFINLYAPKDVVAQEAFILTNAMRTAVIREIIPVVQVVLPNESSVAISDPRGEVGS